MEASKQESLTETLRDELVGTLSKGRFSLKHREVSVMTRLSRGTVDILDALVELEVFSSRSEAVAAFVEEIVLARTQSFDEIMFQADEIREKRQRAKRAAFEAMGRLEK
ncbi:MAG: hypothetical protein EAX95_11600 [Candidatus Thorarchaeota archaeon]|nr:hypothetical protein [Candidatus Thorarchaeota archaeon]